jgi:chemotaxis protein CheC
MTPAEPSAPLVSSEHAELLQELMNVAFGTAAADLAEVMNLYVVLSVPAVGIMPAQELPGFLCSETRDHPRVSVVSQDFWGDLEGSAFLVLPSSPSKELLSVLDGGAPRQPDDAWYEPIDELERESLMEVGNIVISACVGKLAELLGTSVTYTPPSATIDSSPATAIPPDLFEAEHAAVVLQARLCFQDHDLRGFMSIVTSGSCLRWLATALDRFMGQYA